MVHFMALGCINRTARGTRLPLSPVLASFVHCNNLCHRLKVQHCSFKSEWLLWPAFGFPPAPASPHPRPALPPTPVPPSHPPPSRPPAHPPHPPTPVPPTHPRPTHPPTPVLPTHPPPSYPPTHPHPTRPPPINSIRDITGVGKEHLKNQQHLDI